MSYSSHDLEAGNICLRFQNHTSNEIINSVVEACDAKI